MAGFWIKFDTSTSDKPEVWAIAGSLQIDPDAVVGKLLRVWAWFDDQTENGNAPSVTKSLLDRRVSVTGFCDAMVSAGWLLDDGETISLPNFDRHNGKTAKSRCTTAKRVSEHKNRKQKGNAPTVTNSVTAPLPRTEQSRTDRDSKLSPSDSAGEPIADEFVALWNARPGIAKIRKLTPDRRRKLRDRLKDCDWPWREAIARLPLPSSPGKDWQPDVDYLIANGSNAYKIVEGKFDWRGSTGVPQAGAGQNYDPSKKDSFMADLYEDQQ